MLFLAYTRLLCDKLNIVLQFYGDVDILIHMKILLCTPSFLIIEKSLLHFDSLLRLSQKICVAWSWLC